MKTNLIKIEVNNILTWAKYLGDFDYDVYQAHGIYGWEDVVFGHVYQLLDGRIIAILHDGTSRPAGGYEMFRLNPPPRHKGGKRSRKAERAYRMRMRNKIVFEQIEEDDLPF